MKRIVLNVDDNMDDVILLERACRKAKVDFDLRFNDSGAGAINYLAGKGEYAEREAYPLASVILLDLKMPVKSGFEVLQWIRGCSELNEVCVVMFTSSTNGEDVKKAVSLGADCYLVKPLGYDSLVAVARSVDGALRESSASVRSALGKLPECRHAGS